MSISSSTPVALRGIMVALLAIGLQVTFSTETRGQSAASEFTRMATFDHAGETNFALSLNPELNDVVQRASDIVVYVDTSASQSGAYKRDSILALKEILKHLNADDQVKLVAVDLDPVPLTDGFVDPTSNAVDVAIDNLHQRVALGSTDIELMLDSASKEFANSSNKNKNVIYIGDGISRAGILQSKAFEKSVKLLVGNQISVSSFAIGPERNIELLAALANHTGGNIYLDGDNEDAVQVGASALSETVHGSVLWPQVANLDDNIVEFYPHELPPLRSDRDSILVGVLAERAELKLDITGIVNGTRQTMNWSIQPEASSADFSFLPSLIKTARTDRGVTLPTVGSAGLREYKQMLKLDATELAELGQDALLSGNKSIAKELAEASLETDPGNTRATVLAMAATYKIQEDNPFGTNPPSGGAEGDLSNTDVPLIGEPDADPPIGGQDADSPFGFGDEPAAPAGNAAAQSDSPFGAEPAASDPVIPMEADEVVPETLIPATNPEPPAPATNIIPGQELPGQPMVVPPTVDDPNRMTLIGPGTDEVTDRLMVEARQQARDYVLTETDRIRVINERARKQVEFELKRAREELLSNPSAAIERIKNVIEVIDQTSDLYPDTRSELRYSLESSLLSIRQKKLDFDDAREREIVNKANSEAIRLKAVRLEREQEELAELLNRFNSLMSEGNYEAAEQVTRTALAKDPNDPNVVVATEAARVARNYYLGEELRQRKAQAFQATLYQVELASIAFPGDPVMIFPDPEIWKQKQIRRQKYQSIRLSGSDNEEKILQALEEPANLNYEEAPWRDIEEELERQYKINIVIDPTAEDDLNEDELVTVNLTGVRLKNALRLMLNTKNSTFIVKDDVLRIISLDSAEDPKFMATNVYNVGDLVAPRFNPGGGMGGGGGGLGGGQGGGQQGGGGGFGGGGQQGGGGGGGVFCVQESTVLKLGTSSATEPVVTPDSSRRGASNGSPAKPKRISPAGNSDRAVVWNEYFSQTFATPADVRETVRQLISEKKSTEVVELIQAAIHNEQTQSWMYEAMVLAMQIADLPKSDIERALMSAVDLSDDPNDAMYAAQYMAANGMEKRAIRMLKDFAIANPTRTEPFVIGLRAAQEIQDFDGIQWATVGIFSQEWPDHPEIVKAAKYAADAIRMDLKKQGKTNELAAFEDQLATAFERDCYIEVSWTGDADIDLFVAEPSGTICSRLEPRTTAGGVLMGDEFSASANDSGIMSERYVLPKGFAGNYQLLVRRVWGEVTSGKVTVAIHNHYRSENEASLTKQVELDDKGAVVLFALDQGRRTEPLEEQAIATVVKQQLATNRFIMAQQIPGDSSYYGGSTGDSSGGGLLLGGGPLGGLLNGGIRRSAVGYTPIIQSFPEGSFMTVNHATTADRLYVMVSVSPLFSQISSVATFNILGDAATAAGAASAGGGGGNTGGGGGGNTGGGGGGGTTGTF